MFRILLLLLMPTVTASPSTFATGINARPDWSSPENVAASDDTYSAVSIDATTFASDILAVAHFQWPTSIPSSATIHGIQIDFERKATSTHVSDFDVRLQTDGVLSLPVGDQMASTIAWSTSDTVASYGGSTVLWGTTWSPATINDPRFAVRIAAFTTGTATCTIDHISATITYSVASAISGSANITLSPSATIDGPGAITGNATVTLAPAAAIDGPAGIGGASSITLSPAADINGPAEVAGSATITLNATADIAGVGALAGTATITFDPSGLAVDLGIISGAARITFSPTADIEATGGLSGSAGITLNPSADIAGKGALSGGTVIIISPSAVIRGVGYIAGQTSITLSPSGMYDVPPEKALKYRSRPHVTLAGGQRANVR